MQRRVLIAVVVGAMAFAAAVFVVALLQQPFAPPVGKQIAVAPEPEAEETAPVPPVPEAPALPAEIPDLAGPQRAAPVAAGRPSGHEAEPSPPARRPEASAGTTQEAAEQREEPENTQASAPEPETPERAEASPTEREAPEERQAASTGAERQAPEETPAASAGAEPEAPEGAAAGPAPSFDVLRVEPGGEAVIAGRAAPGSEVTVLEEDRSLGRARADARGEWVLVPERPLASDSRELSLEAVGPGGARTRSEEVVILARPGPGEAAEESGERQVAEAEAAEESGEGQAAEAEAAPEPEPGAVERTQTAARAAPERAAAKRAAEGAAEPEAGGGAPLALLAPREGEGPVRILQSPDSPAALRHGGLVLLAVNYTADGRIVVSGRAPADARLRLYVDDTLAGRTRAGAGGRWHMRPEGDVPPGLHVLRVDQVDAAGEVIARVETPFTRSTMVSELDRAGFIIVQPGNTLWRIARRTYGGGWHYTVIYGANSDQIRDPDLIYPGQVFVLPEHR